MGVYPYNGLLLSKKERPTTDKYTMNLKYCAKLKKSNPTLSQKNTHHTILYSNEEQSC